MKDINLDKPESIERMSVNVMDYEERQKPIGTANGHGVKGLTADATDVTLEDCIFYADQQYFNKADDDQQQVKQEAPALSIRSGPLHWLWGPSSPHVSIEGQAAVSEKVCDEGEQAKDTMDRILLRRVTLVRAFFLITADELGPFQSPFVYSQVGYVPATIVLFLMGLTAMMAGIVLNVLFLRIDSDVMPVRNYSYLAQRVWGWYGKRIVEVLFIVQLVFQCAVIMLTNAQSLGLIIDGAANGRHHVCFSLLVLVFCAINLLISPVRSLRAVSFFSMFALGLAIISIITTVAFIYNSPPNFAQALSAFGIPEGPVHSSAFVSQPLSGKVNGIMNMVYAFGGATLFIDIFAEMKKPWLFYKSFVPAQILIITIYLVTGIAVYARQGQFTQPIYYFGVSKYAYQLVGNAIGIYGALIAAVLYGNIAQKEVYYLVVRSIFNGPRLTSRQGFFWWLIGNLFVWTLSYLIAAAIPQVQTVSAVLSAATIMQFSYSFPFLLKFTFDVQLDAMKHDEPYQAGSQLGSRAHRMDSWRDLSRWKRGLFTGNVLAKAFCLVIGLAALSMAGLGLYGSIESMIATFKIASATSFGCATP